MTYPNSLVVHQLLKVYVGLPFSYEENDTTRLQWRILRCDLAERSWGESEKLLDRYARECVGIYDFHSFTGRLPEDCTEDYLHGNLSMSEARKQRSEAGAFSSSIQRKASAKSKKKGKGKVKGKVEKIKAA